MLIVCAAPAHAEWVCYQPNATEGMDTSYGNVYNTGGMPNDPTMKVGGSNGNTYAAAFRFNMSGLTVSATQALLFLYTYPSGTPTALNWYRPNANWQEATANWYRPVDQTFYLGSTSAPSGTGWYVIDFTSLYNLQRSGSPVYFNYGFKVTPTSTANTLSTFFSSDAGNSGYWPALCVNSNSTETRIVLRQPINGAFYIGDGYHFRDDWYAGGSYCPSGVIKKHVGSDLHATAGTEVFLSDDGLVKSVDYLGMWAYRIVVEHDLPNKSGKFTTVYMHVNPLAGITAGMFIPKGTKIATVANLSTGPHLHFGIRIGPYSANVSGVGALPQATCTDPGKSFAYPGFPENFIDPMDTSKVVFHQ